MTRRTASGRPLHWDSYLLLLVGIICAVVLSSTDRTSSSTSLGTYSSTMPGLDGAELEAAVKTLAPLAKTDVIVSSGSRSAYFEIYRQDGGRTQHGSIVVDSQLADGAVRSVSCTVDTTPSVRLTVATNPILGFCATLPIRGAVSDTSSWLDSQYATAQVGFSHDENHGVANYSLTLSQYGNDTTTYDINVRPTY